MQVAVKEVGANALPDDANSVSRVDLSRRFVPQLRRILSGEADPVPPKSPAPRLPPAEELAEQKALLAHLESQYAAARAIVADNPNFPSSTAAAAVERTKKYYSRLLREGADVAGMPLVDVPLLLSLLNCRGDGLLPTAFARVAQLESQLRPPAVQSDAHRKLISTAEKHLRAFGSAFAALRRYEQTAGPRHQFRSARPNYGFNFVQLSETELRRVAEFGDALATDDE